MASTELNVTIKNRSDNSTNWETKNPILLEGEFGYDTTNKKFKIGDGVTKWKDLNYYSPNVTDLDNAIPSTIFGGNASTIF